MEQSHSWEANSDSVNKFPAFYGAWSFISVFTRSRPRPCITFLNKLFYGEVLLAPRPTPTLEDHTLSVIRDFLPAKHDE
jgi:hypothetical protein